MKTICFLLSFFFILFFQKTFAQTQWNTNGNAGTDMHTDFLGTTDSSGLIFKTNNRTRVIITKKGEVGIGLRTPKQMLDVSGNINVSKDAAIYFDNKKVLHVDALNSFFGINDLVMNETGIHNNIFGSQVLYDNLNGSYNSAFGDNILFENTNGSYNTGVGYNALTFHSSGDNNTAIGFEALANNTFSSCNTGIGAYSLYKGSALGTTANTACGFNSLYSASFGGSNTGFGYSALSAMIAGSDNTAIGNATNVNDSASIDNSTAMGNQSLMTASNQVRVGNSSVTSIGGYVDWSVVSDARVNTNVTQNVPGLAFINKLQPVTFKINPDAIDRLLQTPTVNDGNGKAIKFTQKELDARKQKQQMIYTGFVAQDVEQAARSLNYNFSGVDAAKSSKDLYALRYADFVMPLVKAVQELSSANDDKQTQIDSLKQNNIYLQSEIDDLKKMMDGLVQKNNVNVVSISSASLEQNIPNPSSNTTTIGYTLPEKFSSAQMIITDNTGKNLKQINISGSGKGSVTIDASSLLSGNYTYALIIDGRIIATKKMIIAK